jgi:hypothetical protein
MSRFTRGIFGQKPTAAGSSDIIGLDTQYAATVSGTWPTTTSSTGFVAAENFGTSDNGLITYSKHADGLYYPGLFIESAPGANYTAFYAVHGLSVAKGGTHVAAIVDTSTSPSIYDLFVWKNATYGNTSIWRYVTVLTSSTSAKYPYCVAFHPSGNYVVYGTYPAQNAGEQLYAFSRSGDTFTALSSPPTPSASSCFVTAVEWNPQGTSLAVSISISPYIVIYNFSNGVFTKLSAPATLPASYSYSLSWNPAGTSLAYQGTGAVNNMRIYNRSGDTFTSISGLPANYSASYAGAMSWNNNGTLLAHVSTTTSDMAVWSRSGDSFGALSIPSMLISGGINNQAQFNPNGKELLVTQNSGLDIYDVNGTTITRRTTSPFGAYAAGRTGPGSSTYYYGSRMGTTYGGGDTWTTSTPTQFVRWIPPA